MTAGTVSSRSDDIERHSGYGQLARPRSHRDIGSVAIIAEAEGIRRSSNEFLRNGEDAPVSSGRIPMTYPGNVPCRRMFSVDRRLLDDAALLPSTTKRGLALRIMLERRTARRLLDSGE